jgi:hypothetical protein
LIFLAAYENKLDPLHYTMRFIDGLRDDLRAAVLIQRPSTLDIAFVLAQLQEEVAPPVKKWSYKKTDYSLSSKSDTVVPTPPRADKSLTAAPADRRPAEGATAKSTEDRWAALRSYRRAQGLCMRCAEPWSRKHTCSEKI